MNEASNFCPWPCKDPAAYAEESNFPPAAPAVRGSSPRPLPGFPSDFQPKKAPTIKRSVSGKTRRGKGTKAGLPDRNLVSPPYQIANAAGPLSNKTIDTDLVHNGSDSFVEYDTHNLYGTSKPLQHRRDVCFPFLFSGIHTNPVLSDELRFSLGDDSASSQGPSFGD